MRSRQAQLLGYLLILSLSGCGGLHEAITSDPNSSSNLTDLASDDHDAARQDGERSTNGRSTKDTSPIGDGNVQYFHRGDILHPSTESKSDAANALGAVVWTEAPLVRLPSVAFDDSSPGSVDLAGYLAGDAMAVDSIVRLPPAAETSGGMTYRDLFRDQWEGIVSDHRQFYSLPTMIWLTAGVGVGAAMANTSFDESAIRETYVENIILAPSHEYAERFHQAKFLGDGYYTIPAFALLALSEPLIDQFPYGSTGAEWGQRSLRTILVGGPPMLGLQYLTGGSRPMESPEESEWRPFADNNGVSGHAFMGAIPFLSAAKMTDNLWAKSGLYAASALPALSRVNDDDHFLSQVALGWWISYLAASAVDRSFSLTPDVHWYMFSNLGTQGIGVELRR